MGPGGKNMYESVGLGFSPALLFTFMYHGVVYMNPVNPLPLFEKIEVIHALRCHRILTVLLKRSEVTFFFFLNHVADVIIVLHSGMESVTLQCKHVILSTGPSGNLPQRLLLHKMSIYFMLWLL